MIKNYALNANQAYKSLWETVTAWIHKNPGFFSFLISLLLLGGCAFTGVMKFEVSDDFMMEAIVSGAYGGNPSPHIMFMSPMLGLLFQSLYSLCPGLNWYVWFQVIVILGSSTAILRSSIQSNEWRYILSAFSIVLLISLDGYQLMQFTKTAVFSISAGFSLYYIYYREKTTWHDLIAGTVLILAGTFIRFAVFFIVAALYLVLVVLTLCLWSEKKRMIRRIILCACLAACSLSSVLLLRRGLDLGDSYTAYREYSSVRAEIVDYPHPEYSEVEEQLKEIGFGEIEYAMVFEWLFADSDTFDYEKMRELLVVLQDYRENKNIIEILKELKHQKYWLFVSFWVCLFVFILNITAGMKRAATAVILCLFGILLLFYNAYQGRLVYRVDFCVFFALACTLMNLQILPGNVKRPSMWLLLLLYSVLIGTRVYFYIPDYSPNRYEIMNYSWANDLRKYRCAFAGNDFSEFDEFVRNSDGFFYFDFNTGIQSYYLNVPMLQTIPEDTFENLMFLCGVDYLHPSRTEMTESVKLNGELTDLLRDKVYLIDNRTVPLIRDFLEEKTGETVSAEKIAELDGYTIWNLSLEEN